MVYSPLLAENIHQKPTIIRKWRENSFQKVQKLISVYTARQNNTAPYDTVFFVMRFLPLLVHNELVYFVFVRRTLCA